MGCRVTGGALGGLKVVVLPPTPEETAMRALRNLSTAALAATAILGAGARWVTVPGAVGGEGIAAQ